MSNLCFFSTTFNDWIRGLVRALEEKITDDEMGGLADRPLGETLDKNLSTFLWLGIHSQRGDSLRGPRAVVLGASRWTSRQCGRASAAATEVAAAAQEQAKAAAAAAQEQAEALQRTEAFGHLERTLGEIRANTIAAAEQGERNLRVLMENDDEKRTARALADASPRRTAWTTTSASFSRTHPETFAEYPRDALHAEWEMTPWRETHARLVLDRVPAVGQLRYAIVPRRLDDEQFWRVYFALCAPRLAKHAAANAAAELRRRRFAEAEAAAAAADDAVEIEMTAAGDAHRADTDAGVDAENLAVPLSVGPAEAAAALAAEYAGCAGGRRRRR